MMANVTMLYFPPLEYILMAFVLSILLLELKVNDEYPTSLFNCSHNSILAGFSRLEYFDKSVNDI